MRYNFPNNYTVIDLETTGLSAEQDHIIEVAAVRVRNSKIVDSFSSLLHDPNANVTEYITSLTGITQSMVDDAPDIRTILNEYLAFIGTDILVGHNVSFDIGFLNSNCLKLYGQQLSNDSIDTCARSRELIRESPRHSLVFLTDFLSIDQDLHHRALADCYSTKALYDILNERNSTT